MVHFLIINHVDKLEDYKEAQCKYSLIKITMCSNLQSFVSCVNICFLWTINNLHKTVCVLENGNIWFKPPKKHDLITPLSPPSIQISSLFMMVDPFRKWDFLTLVLFYWSVNFNLNCALRNGNKLDFDYSLLQNCKTDVLLSRDFVKVVHNTMYQRLRPKIGDVRIVIIFGSFLIIMKQHF